MPMSLPGIGPSLSAEGVDLSIFQEEEPLRGREEGYVA